jgi:hypothetical protein
MKKMLLSLTLLLCATSGFAQKGFGIDGSFGIGYNGGNMAYPVLLEGRIQYNDYFSTNLGVGFWNSGFKGSWNSDDKSIYYNLNSNKTLPSLQLGTRGELPVFRYQDKQVCLFLEPKLVFLPFSAQKVSLLETYFDVKTNDVTGEVTRKPTGVVVKTNTKSECHPRLYGMIQAGFTVELTENVDLAVSYGYTPMDLFQDLRGKTIKDSHSNDFSMDKYLPARTDLHLLNVGFRVNFDLN